MRQLFYVNAFVVYIINCHLWRSCERKNNFSTFVVESYEDIYFMSGDIYDYHWMQRKNLYSFMSESHGDDRNFLEKYISECTINLMAFWIILYFIHTWESRDCRQKHRRRHVAPLPVCLYCSLFIQFTKLIIFLWRKYLVIFTVKSSYITHPQLQVHFI